MSINSSYSQLRIPEEALNFQQEAAARPRFSNELIRKVNAWVKDDAPTNGIEPILESCRYPAPEPTNELFSTHVIDTLSMHANAPARRILSAQNNKLLHDAEASLQFKDTNQVCLSIAKIKRCQPGKKLVGFGKEHLPDFGYIPEHTTVANSVVFKEQPQCTSCKRIQRLDMEEPLCPLR